MSPTARTSRAPRALRARAAKMATAVLSIAAAFVVTACGASLHEAEETAESLSAQAAADGYPIHIKVYEDKSGWWPDATLDAPRMTPKEATDALVYGRDLLKDFTSEHGRETLMEIGTKVNGVTLYASTSMLDTFEPGTLERALTAYGPGVERSTMRNARTTLVVPECPASSLSQCVERSTLAANTVVSQLPEEFLHAGELTVAHQTNSTGGHIFEFSAANDGANPTAAQFAEAFTQLGQLHNLLEEQDLWSKFNRLNFEEAGQHITLDVRCQQLQAIQAALHAAPNKPGWQVTLRTNCQPKDVKPVYEEHEVSY